MKIKQKIGDSKRIIINAYHKKGEEGFKNALNLYKKEILKAVLEMIEDRIEELKRDIEDITPSKNKNYIIKMNCSEIIVKKSYKIRELEVVKNQLKELIK